MASRSVVLLLVSTSTAVLAACSATDPASGVDHVASALALVQDAGDAAADALVDANVPIDELVQCIPPDESLYNICTNRCLDYANRCFEECMARGIPCYVLTFGCTGATIGHAVNVICTEATSCCIVEPQSNPRRCIPGTSFPKTEPVVPPADVMEEMCRLYFPLDAGTDAAVTDANPDVQDAGADARDASDGSAADSSTDGASDAGADATKRCTGLTCGPGPVSEPPLYEACKTQHSDVVACRNCCAAMVIEISGWPGVPSEQITEFRTKCDAACGSLPPPPPTPAPATSNAVATSMDAPPAPVAAALERRARSATKPR
ncbi:MAG: hypothetical protein U0169_06935 [Polyangiaceae bacterium]